MSTQELRFEPMTTGMVLDRAFRLYVQNFPLMAGISAIINIPLLLLTVLSTTFLESIEKVQAESTHFRKSDRQALRTIQSTVVAIVYRS